MDVTESFLQYQMGFNDGSETLIKVNITDIVKNPLNEVREALDTEQDILDLVESIRDDGLQNPLVVYKGEFTDGNQKYVLVSGHRRHAALMKLLEQKDTRFVMVPVHIVDKPTSKTKEVELLCENNMSRRSEDAVNLELAILKQNWDEMESSAKAALTQKYRERFINENSLVLPEDQNYIDNNFRPVYYYIREHSLLDYSDATFKRHIKSGKQVIEEAKAPKDNEIPQLIELEEDSSTEGEAANVSMPVQPVKKESDIEKKAKVVKRAKGTMPAFSKFTNDTWSSEVCEKAVEVQNVINEFLELVETELAKQ